MTTLNKVKTSAPYADVAPQDTHNILQKFADMPAIYKLGILIIQTAINVTLFTYLFFWPKEVIFSTLNIKDTMLPIQYLYNINILNEIFRHTKAKDLYPVYPKFYVGVSLYIYHVQKLNTELQKYLAGQPYDFTFNEADNRNKTNELLPKLRHYEVATDKTQASDKTFKELIAAKRENELILMSVYGVQGYIPDDIKDDATYNALLDSTEARDKPRCRLVVTKPTEQEQELYKKMEQYFNTLFQDPYVSFALQFMQENMDIIYEYHTYKTPYAKRMMQMFIYRLTGYRVKSLN